MSGESPKVPGRNDGKLIVGCGSAILGVLVLVVIGLIWASSQPPYRPPMDANSADAMCQRWVTNSLKSPTSASFGVSTYTGTPKSGLVIRGTVDADNTFGAKIRTVWSCEIRLSQDGEQWEGHAEIS